jgi:predicted nucleotidyltransferase component of viral defense system
VTRPVSPQAFANSLRARAANTAKATGIPTRELLERYFHRRLLARVFHADGDGWVLKGGQALLVRWPKARYSTDVDLIHFSVSSMEDAVAALLAAVATPLDDHLRFEHHDTSKEAAANRPSRKVRFKVMHGLRQLSMVSVDVVVGETTPVGDIVSERLAAPFTVESDPWPLVRMWPLEDHVADKIAAMYERHGAGLRASTRFKDLVDLVLIALNSPVQGPVAHAALMSEVERRRAAGTHLELPSAFTVPDPAWTSGYRAEAAKARDLSADCRTLGGVTPLADAFVSPLLRIDGPAGTWDCDTRRWVEASTAS